MKKREYKKQKRRVERLFDKWRTPLGLRWWASTIFWHDERKKSSRRSDAHVVFSTVADWPYMHYYIDVYLPEVRDRTDEELEQDVLHELCHVLVAELQVAPEADRQAHTERVVTTLALAMRWVYDSGKEATPCPRMNA